MHTMVIVDTDDADHADAVVAELWPHVKIQPRNGGGRTRIRRTTLGSLHLDDVEFDHDVDFLCDPVASPSLMCVRAGAVDYENEGDVPQRFGPGRAAALAAVAGQTLTGHIFQAHYHLISLSPNAFGDVAVSHDGGPVRFTSPVPLSDVENRQLVRVADYVCSTAAATAAGTANPAVSEAVERLVAATMLAALPSTAVLDATPTERGAGTPALLIKAIAFIEKHLRDDISLDDIASAVYVTPRALQYMFRKHRNCTPMEYLRAVRLDHAHRDLLAADRSVVTVAEVARRWGFGHLGRFATNYRMAFGESPHETLRG
jgi:AraC-like DNA-binding protein